MSAEAKQRIFGHNLVSSRPRVQLFDATMGQPLFWSERKPRSFYECLYEDLSVAAVVDLSPGSGGAACAALQKGISYCGFPRNVLHADFLNKILDRQALRQMVTAGSPLFRHDLQPTIQENFATVLDDMAEMETAVDTTPESDDIDPTLTF